ncbi:MAG: capsid assembly protein [Pararhizobium sp.]
MTGVVNIASVPTTEDPEAAAAAQAKALEEAAAAAPTTEAEARAAIEAGKAAPAERPTWLPEKFQSAEDLARAYSELEAKLSGKPAAEEAAAEKPKDGENKTEEKTEGEAPKATEVVSKLTDIFTEKGELGEDDYALAEKAGFDRATVDNYIAGQKALQEAATDRITAAAGGQENMERMFAWAKTGLKPSEIDTYNQSFAGGDVNSAAIAMEQLKARYEQANGRDPRLVSGKPGGNSSDVYESWAQVTADMGDPKYRSDAAFRAKVAAKLGRSNPR